MPGRGPGEGGGNDGRIGKMVRRRMVRGNSSLQVVREPRRIYRPARESLDRNQRRQIHRTARRYLLLGLGSTSGRGNRLVYLERSGDQSLCSEGSGAGHSRTNARLSRPLCLGDTHQVIDRAFLLANKGPRHPLLLLLLPGVPVDRPAKTLCRYPSRRTTPATRHDGIRLHWTY